MSDSCVLVFVRFYTMAWCLFQEYATLSRSYYLHPGSSIINQIARERNVETRAT